jgi:site-specific DNA-cytosine methylase
MTRLILDLCSGSGAWSQPYRDAGYVVDRVDIGPGDLGLGRDVRDYIPSPATVRALGVDSQMPIRGVLAAPPCTEFAVSGARWWDTKNHWRLHDALSIVDACLRIIFIAKPKWWCLENPVGLLTHYLGEPDLIFDPCDYGDPYTKKTCLWGKFNHPVENRIEPSGKNPIHNMPPSPDRARLRSITPPGFAKAFFEANP